VVPAYADFAPRALRVEVPDPDALVAAVSDDRRFVDASVDQYVIAGLATYLRHQPRQANIDRIALGQVESTACIADVAEMYGQAAEELPDLPLWAHPATLDDLTPCAAEGLLFRALVDCAEAGVVAACRDNDHGVAGFQIQELVLDAAHRRRGLAPGVLQRLIDELPAQRGDTLWGRFIKTTNRRGEMPYRSAVK
jgi:GNAT superfamily N-acetyltransferase